MNTPLNIKTDNYLLKSMIKINDLIEFAVNNNIKSLTITDNNMYGVIDFYKCCKNNHIKPIIGLEIKLDNNIIILYCMNYQGYQNLIKLSTIMSERELNINDLDKYSSNLIAIIPYESINIYDKLFFYEYKFKSYKNEQEKNNLSGNLVYMNEFLCLNKEDTKYLKYLEAIKEGITVNFIETDYIDNYLKIVNDKNNELITNLCNVELPFNQKLMPKFNNPDNIDSYTYLKKQCIKGLKKHFGNTISSTYQERLKYELEIINKMGFCDYFLIVSDYVNYAKTNNIIVGTGRGSAVGSLVAYCLSITDVDPIKYNLIFERFLNPERISMPDIDIDFEHLKREEVINYCITKYGEKRVAPIIAFGTLSAKQVLRDVGRSLNIELKYIDSMCKLINPKLTLKENYNSNNKLRDLLSRKKELNEVYNIAYKFEGIKRHTTIHAAGIIMSSVDLDTVIPLDKSHEFYTTGYNDDYLEEIGLLKMDFLAIKYLTTIHNIIDSINNNEHTNITFENIPLNDIDAIKIFTKGDTVGIFQFESEGMINFLKQLKPNTMDDLFAAIALFRPGPMKNIPSYIRRKNKQEKIDYLDSSLESILKPTYGIIIYQEQIMQIANIMADYTLGEADILRKAMSKKNKELLLKEEAKFTSRSINKGYDKELVKEVYSKMLKFAEYGFNKSHSVGYAIIAYKMAYLKAHYRKYFIINLLNMDSTSIDKIKLYIYEAKSYGINILKPDINKSFKEFKIEEGGIRFPFNVKNLGINAINTILEERKNGKYIDIYDFIKRCYGKSVNKKVLESLILIGFFDSFRYNRKTLYDNLDVIVNYGDLIKDMDPIYDLKPEIEEKVEFSKKELMSFELELLGFYLSNHPLTDIKIKYSNIINTNEINEYFDNIINIIITVDRIKEVITKKNDKMLFITGSDELGKIDIVLFPKVYEKYSNIKKDDIILVKGRVEKRFDEYQIITNSVEILMEEL